MKFLRTEDFTETIFADNLLHHRIFVYGVFVVEFKRCTDISRKRHHLVIKVLRCVASVRCVGKSAQKCLGSSVFFQELHTCVSLTWFHYTVYTRLYGFIAVVMFTCSCFRLTTIMILLPLVFIVYNIGTGSTYFLGLLYRE